MTPNRGNSRSTIRYNASVVIAANPTRCSMLWRVVAVLMTSSQSTWSKWGVSLYLIGRLAYLPLYAAGTFLVRSLAWNVATFGIAAVFIALFV